MNAKTVMSHPVISAPAESTLGLVARLMWDFDCGIVPLVDDEGRIAGVITDRDICMAAYTQGKPLGAIRATSAMASGVVACRPEDTIESVEKLMRDNQLRRVPVLDADGRPIGLVSLNDIAQIAASGRKGAADRAVVQTLAAIGQPRSVRPDKEDVTTAA
jgi:CBS domain-containing protein